ncbi:aminofutalosine synthase MqnE [Archaeoglobales archaeon]|nr:MAG: aminofutalosine synthase MqnE [Archaeoglobales archaeon]
MKFKEIKDLFNFDLHELGIKADSINNTFVTFVVNRHINYTNICISKCPLCAFHRGQNDEDAYLMPKEEVLRRAKEAVDLGATELHIVGSHNPAVTIEYFERIFNEMKQRFPDVTIKALTATEIDFLAKKEKMSILEILKRLKNSGLQAMPGGGAEILDDRIRKIICPNKAKSNEWIRIMKIAHKVGIKSNATMLFGHIEKVKHRARHLYKLRKLQEKTNGFISFIPLLFHPENTKLKEMNIVEEKTNPVDILKTIAVSRIVLDNFKSVRAYWVMLGEKLTQIALNYGANDVDGTIIEERITHAAGAKTPVYLPLQKILELIKGANKIPAQRDTFYNIIRVYS